MPTRDFIRLLTPAIVLAAAAPVVGCGPIAFEGGSALSIVGTPPAPEAEPEPEPEKPKLVEVKSDRIQINEKIQFELNKAVIKSESDALLTEIAKVMNEHPRIKKIEIQGHASSEGSDRYNLKLSDRRAKAVMKWLTDAKKGKVDEKRLTAKGYGETKPIASNDTEDGREKNRRVEFMILEQDVTTKKVEKDPDTGEEKVIEEKTEKVKK
jgi:OOP family OmpA-OmpF porin